MGSLHFALGAISTQRKILLLVKATEQPTLSSHSTLCHVAEVQGYGQCRVQNEEAREVLLETASERRSSQVHTKQQRLLLPEGAQRRN